MKKNYAGCSQRRTLAKNDSTPLKAKLTWGCTLLLSALMLLSCNGKNNNSDPEPKPKPTKVEIVYVLNEGNMGASNGTLTEYNVGNKSVINEAFSKSNEGAALGDTPTMFKMIDGKAFIVINGSGKIYVIDPETNTLTGKIVDLGSPRCIEVISPNKAYVSDLFNPEIKIINPTTLQKTGSISLGEGNYAEMFVRKGNYIYTNLWSYGTKILKIDITTDKVVGEVEVGTQPLSLFEDNYGKLWTMTDGGYQGGPLPFEDPAIICIDPDKMTIDKKLPVKRGGAIMYKMVMSADRESIYYIDKNVYKMSVKANELPSEPFISYKDEKGKVHNYYSIGVNPKGGDIYLGDAYDFMHDGMVVRYSVDGKLIDSFSVGINPGNFGFASR